MKIVLSENWELTGSYPGFWAFGRSMEVNVELKGIVPWIPASVPGSVHWDLHRAGYLPDPYFGANALACEWVNERDWLYKTSFTSETSWIGKKVRLVLDGIDYSAKVLLNGKEIGSHIGMFAPGEFDLSESLRYGESNTLVVVLERSPDGVAQLGYTDRVDHLKSRFGYKWDFCPKLVHLGLWKQVNLIISEWCTFDDVHIEAVPGKNGSGEAVVNTLIESERSGRFRLTAVVYDSGGYLVGTECYEGDAAPRLLTVRQRIALEKADLWWPNGYGEQPLYKVQLRLEIMDAEGRYYPSDDYGTFVGFRTLSFQSNPGAPTDALAYTIGVNEKTIYIKGWNWVPVDQLYGRNREQQLRHLLTLAKRANVNMLRVWGGGLIEQESFYSLCDEMGILIWQEMMQSSSGFNNEPSINPVFLHTLSQTMRHVIREKRNHPSLAIWCGGNELTEGGHLDDRMVSLTDRQTNLRMLRNLVSDLDESRHFLPTSPMGPSFFLEADKSGEGIMYDVHGPWKYAGVTEHYRLYNNSDALLHSEYGGDGFASLESLGRFLPEHKLGPEHSGSVEWLQHGYEYWNMNEQLRSLFGDVLGTMQQMVEASQWLQAEGIRYAVEANRRRASQCSGSLLWQFNEPYPNISCTSAVDYYGDPKLAYSWVAKANRNLHVSLQYDSITYLPGEDFQARIFLTNDGIETGNLMVEWRAMDSVGRKIAESVKEFSDTKYLSAFVGLVEFIVPEQGAFFITLKVIDSFDQRAESDNEYAFSIREREEAPPLRAFLDLPQTLLEWKVIEEDSGSKVFVSNRGATVALWVRICCESEVDTNQPAVRPLEDGFLVFPGETVVRRIDGVMPEGWRWKVHALNS